MLFCFKIYFSVLLKVIYNVGERIDGLIVICIANCDACLFDCLQ